MALDRNAIMGAADIPVRVIAVPEWNGEVYVKRQSIRERDALIPMSRGFMDIEPPKKEGDKPKITMKKGADAEESYAKYRLFTVGFALCDEKGNRLFNEDEIESALGAKSTEAIERIFNELGNAFNDETKAE